MSITKYSYQKATVAAFFVYSYTQSLNGGGVDEKKTKRRL